MYKIRNYLWGGCNQNLTKFCGGGIVTTIYACSLAYKSASVQVSDCLSKILFKNLISTLSEVGLKFLSDCSSTFKILRIASFYCLFCVVIGAIILSYKTWYLRENFYYEMFTASIAKAIFNVRRYSMSKLSIW